MAITLTLIATNTITGNTKRIPATSIDDAKTKLDGLNPIRIEYAGEVEMADETGDIAIWEDAEFGIRDLHDYFDEIDKQGGYETHAYFAHDIGSFHNDLDGLFNRLKQN